MLCFGSFSIVGLSDSHKAFCFQVRIARIFNTYGPRMCLDDGRVVSNFVAQVNHLPISLFMIHD